MTMTLTNLLTELATLYRRYGDVEVLIETPTDLIEINRVDADIFNTKPNDVRVIIETVGVEETAPEETETEAHEPPKIPTQRTSSRSSHKTKA